MGKRINATQKIRIGDTTVGAGEPAYVIAEVAGSHEGNLETAKKMVIAASEAGAGAVKFQIFQADELVTAHHPKYKSFQEVEFQPEEWNELLEYAQNFKIVFLADVFDLPSLQLMDRLEVHGYKIHLTNLTNPYMLTAVAKTKKPVFLATGGAKPEEIESAINILKNNGNDNIILMQGYQAYPTRLEEVNFRAINKLRKMFQCPVGFLDHVDGGTEMAMIVPIVSIAWDACVIEKHFTLDRNLGGRDYFSALNPDEFKLLVQNIREIEKTFGTGDFKLSAEELKYRNEVMKNIVARVHIARGTQITEAMLAFKRSEPGLPPSEASRITGRFARADIDKDENITWDNV